jgi:hypothetical protein
MTTAPPSKLDVLAAIVRAGDAMEERRRADLAARTSHVADHAGVLAALQALRDATWLELHAWFPEAQHEALRRSLDDLQRGGQIGRYITAPMAFYLRRA